MGISMLQNVLHPFPLLKLVFPLATRSGWIAAGDCVEATISKMFYWMKDDFIMKKLLSC